MDSQDEDERLRSVALQTSQSILLVRRRAEQELMKAKQALEAKTEELAHSLSVMRATLEATTDGIMVVDENGRISTYNEQFVRLWRFPRDVVIGDDRGEVLRLAARQMKHPEHFLARTREIYAQSLPESFDVLEFSDGRVVERTSKLQRMDERAVGRVWSYRDITERRRADVEREELLVSEKEARARAERETRMKDEFLATLSHELRTPLNAILGWATILGTSDDPKDIPEAIEVIERNARAQAQIIEDLLDMSRIISGKVLLDVQRIDLVPIIRVAMELVAPMASAKGIRFSSAFGQNASSISGDPARIQQVLWNLLTNALKFTPREGSVTVETERVGSSIQIRLADSGQGITPDFLPHVFDRFRQADASTTRRHGGLGLGLAIVKNLVELHGGTVRVESAGQDEGCTFTVSFPIAAVDLASESQRVRSQAPKAGASLPFKADLAGLRILAVDDELDARELLKRILRNCGAVVALAGSAGEAMAAFRASPPHVLIMDIGMPGEDGYAVLERVRALRKEDGGEVPAIALTAFARAEDRARALRSGFQVHLSKPVDAAELIASVAEIARTAQR